MSQASGIEGAQDQHAHNDEQPSPQNDTIVPIKEEKVNDEPSAELPSRILNAEPSQPEPHVHESTSSVAPVGDLALEAEKVMPEKDQPSLSELAGIMKQVLGVLQDSTIVSKSGKDTRSRFWGVYKRVAEEHDSEFLERYTSDMDIVLVFSGLFSAVSTSFIVAMESNLKFDTSDTTNALLAQLVQIGLGNLATASSAPVPLASTWSPSAMTIWIQIIAYASLSMSLLAAFGAVLGKQWLGYYKSNRYGRGSQEGRGKRRQEMFDGIVTWYFDAVVQSFPVLLQISLLLFGIALGANIWTEQPSIAWVIIATTVFGFLFYSLTVMACLVSPFCPFQTPISTILRMLKIHRALYHVLKPVVSLLHQLMSVYYVLQYPLGIVRRRWNRLAESLRGSVHAASAYAQQSFQALFTRITTLHNGLRFFIQHSPAKVVDSEAQSPDQDMDVLVENGRTVALDFRDKSTRSLEAPSIKWLLETSTDPEVFLAAARLVPQVEWPLDLEVSDLLHQLYADLTSCVGFHGQIVPSLMEKASACIMALSHLYCGRVLRAYPDHGDFLGCEGGDYQAFLEMNLLDLSTVNNTVLATAMKIRLPNNNEEPLWFPSSLHDCPNFVPEWLSHSLPYHFVTGRVDEAVENLAIAVLSKLLSPSSSPSNQTIANCALLACVMIGVQFDKKDIARIDKSSALPELLESLLAQFQKVLWACDGGDLEKDSTGVTRRAWNLLDIICLMLDPAKHYYCASFHIMQNLDMCRKIYSRAMSPEVLHHWDTLDALGHALRFTLTAVQVSRDPAELWRDQGFWTADSYSPEDFDWLVDYLDYIYSYNQEAAFDILLLLEVMQVRCSPAKQYQFIKSVIACMYSSMPSKLRHAALRAAHSTREEIVSINIIDDVKLRDWIMTEFPPAILTAVCPQPGTPIDDGPDRFLDEDRDLRYLELVFTLMSNSQWHPHLSGDHIDRCISIAKCDYIAESHAFLLAGIFLQVTPGQLSVTSLDSITGKQWWDMMSRAWGIAYKRIGDKSLPILVEGTKRYLQNAPEYDLEKLIRDINYVFDMLEEQHSEQGEGDHDGFVVAVKELRTAASDMLEKLANSYY